MTADTATGSHTEKEIRQQPWLWRRVGADLGLDRARAMARDLLRDERGRILLTGAGTSAFAGQILAPELTRRLRRRVDAVPTTDLVSSPLEHFAQDVPTLLVSFARSGDSPESVASTELADRCLSDVRHLVVTCNADGELARRHGDRSSSEVLLLPPEANDRGFAMTSSFTGMSLAAWLALAGPAEPDLGDRLADVGAQVLDGYAAPAEALVADAYRRIVYLGSGALTGLARESALKVLELTAGRVVGVGDSPLAFRHGPKAILDPQTLVVVFLSNDAYTRAYDLDLLAELRRSHTGGRVVAVTADRPGTVADDDTWLLRGAGDLHDPLLALPAVLVAQLLAQAASRRLGLTVDNPFPSGAVNRVVQGVTIHELPGGPERGR